MGENTVIKRSSGIDISKNQNETLSINELNLIQEILAQEGIATYWDDPEKQKILEKCIKLDAYFSARIEWEFEHLSKSQKCFDEMSGKEYEKVKQQLMLAYTNSELHKTFNQVFKKHPELKATYMEDAEYVFSETITKASTSFEIKEKTKKQNNTETKTIKDAISVKSELLLPFLFFNFILRHEVAYDTLLKRKKKYKSNSDWRQALVNNIENLFEICDISAEPKILGYGHRKEFLKLIENLNTTEACPKNHNMYSFLREKTDKICKIILNYPQVAINNEVVKRQELFCRIGQAVKNKIYFINLAYALALHSDLLLRFHTLNYGKSQEHNDQIFDNRTKSLINNGCLAVAMQLTSVEQPCLTEAQLAKVLKQKAEVQKLFTESDDWLTKDQEKEFKELIKNTDLFSFSLHKDLWEYFLPGRSALDTLDSVHKVNSIVDDLVKLYSKYNRLESKEDDLESLFKRTLYKDHIK